jgi:hypothetical protein
MPLEYENTIVWNYDPALFPFVREAFFPTTSAKRPITLRDRDGRVLIGYAVHNRKGTMDEIPSRRFFYLMPCDFDVYSNGKTPAWAIDPLTVREGVSGYKTARCATPLTKEQRAAIQSIFTEARAKTR